MLATHLFEYLKILNLHRSVLIGFTSTPSIESLLRLQYADDRQTDRQTDKRITITRDYTYYVTGIGNNI